MQSWLKHPVLIAAVAAWGCSGQGSDQAAQGKIPDGMGVLELYLSYQDAPGVPLSGILRITDEADPSNTVERTYEEIQTNVVMDTVPLAPGTYEVSMEVTNAYEESVYYGSKTGVIVAAGQLTTITLDLAPSGGVGVIAKMSTYGRVFTCQEPIHPPDESGPFQSVSWITGAQRPEMVEITEGGTTTIEQRPMYYMWVNHEETWYRFTSLDPTSWTLWDEDDNFLGEPITGPSGFRTRLRVTVAGGDFYAYDNKHLGSPTIYHSHDGLVWDVVAKPKLETETMEVPYSSGGSYTVFLNQVPLSCALLADNQFNLFCLAPDWYCVDECPNLHEWAWITGIFTASSADGMAWPKLPPLKEFLAFSDQDVDFKFGEMQVATRSPLINPDSYSITAARMNGSVYRIWTWISTGGLGSQSYHTLYESVDREHWAERPVVFLPDSEGPDYCDTDFFPSGSWAAYVTAPDGETQQEMHVFTLIYSSSGDYRIGHYKSVE